MKIKYISCGLCAKACHEGAVTAVTHDREIACGEATLTLAVAHFLHHGAAVVGNAGGDAHSLQCAFFCAF